MSDVDAKKEGFQAELLIWNVRNMLRMLDFFYMLLVVYLDFFLFYDYFVYAFFFVVSTEK